MANVRAIRTHIKSVESTRKITKSMKMVAAAKLKRTQQSMHALRPFAAAARDMLARLGEDAAASSGAYTAPREIRRVCYVLFVGNRGLCGVYNTALVKFMEGRLESEEHECFLLVVGRWGREQLGAAHLPVEETIDDIPDAPSEEDAQRLAERIKAIYRAGEADEIILVYEEYLSALRQEPTALRLLPLAAAAEQGEKTPLILEPDAETVTDALVELVLDSTVRAVLLEAKTGEHTARMTAMTAASDNTEQLLDKLRLELNHARQSAITTEISEIVGGANALEEGKHE